MSGKTIIMHAHLLGASGTQHEQWNTLKYITYIYHPDCSPMQSEEVSKLHSPPCHTPLFTPFFIVDPVERFICMKQMDWPLYTWRNAFHKNCTHSSFTSRWTQCMYSQRWTNKDLSRLHGLMIICSQRWKMPNLVYILNSILSRMYSLHFSQSHLLKPWATSKVDFPSSS